MTSLHSVPLRPLPRINDGKNLRVLIVDDNEAIHDDFRKILGANTSEAEFAAAEAEIFGPGTVVKPRLAFEMTFASQGAEALDHVRAAREAGQRFSVVFMDVRMPPGWDGLETTVKLWEVDPDLQVVICTAYSDKSWEEMMESIPCPERLLILKKPFDAIEVLQMAHALAEKWSLLQSSRRNMEELERTVDKRTHDLKAANALLEAEITCRKATEKELRGSEASMAAAQRMTHFGSWEIDLTNLENVNSNPLRWSDETFRIFGLEPGSVPVTNELFFNSVPEDEHAAIATAIAGAIRDRSSCLFVHHVRRPTGEERTVQETAHYVGEESHGGAPMLVGTVLDITERKQSEETLRMHGRVLESMAEGVMVWDQSGVILFINEACSLIFGYGKGELPGEHLSRLDIIPPDEGLSLLDQLSGHVQDNGAWMGELTGRKKNKASVVTRASISGLEVSGATAFVAVFEDITERKDMEAQLLRSQRMESVGRLSSGIAHDLNNILTPILMCAFMMRRQLPDDEFERALDTIETSTQRGADLIKQLLTFGRGGGGQRRAVQLDVLARDLAKMIKETFPRNVTFCSDIPAESWPVIGDATQLQQILLNLCVNARDAMHQGGTLTLSIKNAVLREKEAVLNPEAGAGPFVHLQVSDTGEGIPPEVIDKIFDPFFTTKSDGKGTGLGLSTVMGIVKSHHGFVNVSSKPGAGTTFEIYLPASPSVTEKTAAAAPAVMPATGNGELILLVDDEAGIRKVLTHALIRHGYRVLPAEDGDTAITLYSAHKEEISAVLTDVMMPRMDGVALIHGLKTINPMVKVIAASGLGDSGGNEDRAAELSALGVTSFLRKPFSAIDVLTAFHELLGKN